MIIECPACATRYNIKAELPPEGRTVRCAKCGTVWRAVAGADDGTEEMFASTGNDAEAANNPGPHGHTSSPEYASDETGSYTETQSQQDDAGSDDENGLQDHDWGSLDREEDPGLRFLPGVQTGSAAQPDENVYSSYGYAGTDNEPAEPVQYPRFNPPARDEDLDQTDRADVTPNEDDDGPLPGFFSRDAEPEDVHAAEDNPAATATANHDNAAQEQPGNQKSKVRWLGALFRSSRKNRPVSESADVSGAGDAARPSNTIPFPRASVEAASGVFANADENGARARGQEFQTLEDARAAVRGVFANLSDAAAAGATRHSHAAPILSRAAAPVTGLRARTPEGKPDVSDYESSSGGEDESLTRTAGQHSGDESGAWRNAYAVKPQQEEDEYAAGYAGEVNDAETWGKPQDAASEENARLQGQDEYEDSGDDVTDSALLRRRDYKDQYDDGDAEAFDEEQPYTVEAAGEQLARDLETTLKSAPNGVFRESGGEDDGPRPDQETEPAEDALWRRPKFPLDDLERDAASEAEAEEPAEMGSDDVQIEERLARELQDRKAVAPSYEKEAQPENRGGGLVLASAWGLFLCIATGMAVSFFSFRDMIADAMPGAAPAYSAIGLPVTIQPLVFDDVQYRWALTEGGKPMIVLTGSLFNKAQKKVRVPDLHVGIKHKDPAEDRAFTTKIQTERSKIRPGQSVDFTLELVSPKRSIASIELEIRNVR